jgi:hypothetical protein
MQILKEHLQYVSVKVYQIQGEKNASFKNQMLLEICYL